MLGCATWQDLPPHNSIVINTHLTITYLLKEPFSVIRTFIFNWVVVE